MMVRWSNHSSILKIVLGSFLLSSTFIHGQEIDFDAYLKKHTGSHIARLIREETVTLDMVKSNIQAKTTYNEDYLILSKEGGGMMSEDEITFSSFETIKNITAYSYDARVKSGKKIKATNFKTSDAESEGSVFHDDNKVTSFLFPGLKEGMIRHLNYEVEHHEFRFPFGFQFFAYYPTEKSVFTIDSDTSIHMLVHDFNFEGMEIIFKEELIKNRRISSWTCTKSADYKSESYAPEAFFFLPGIITQISHYYADGKRINVLGNLEDLVNWYSENVDEVMNEQPSEELISITNSLIANKQTELEKVESIYYWVQDNVKYIAFEDGMGGFIPRYANMVCERRFGDCKDMAMLIYKMLTIAGIEGNIAWVGTNSIPFKYSIFPSTAVDNHMIAVYYHNGQPIFLDATSTLQPITIPSYGIQGKEALVYRSKKQYKVETVEIPEAQETEIHDNVFITIQDRKIIGTCSSELTGYYKWVISIGLQRMNKKKVTEKVEEFYDYGNNSFTVKEASIKGLDDRSLPLDFNFTFEIENYALTIDNEVYVNMILSKDIVKEKELKSTRISPFIMDFRSNDNYTVTLQIPDGMKVKSLPSNLEYSSENVKFKIDYTVKGNQIVMNLNNAFNFLVLQKDKFKEWNDYLNVLNKALSSSVVLIKN